MGVPASRVGAARRKPDGGPVTNFPPWIRVKRTDPRARELADRHYSRQKIGALGFVPPGRCLVLLTPCERAYWVTSYPFAEYVKHAWAGAWTCSAFRNEGAGTASDLIRSAVAYTRGYFGDPPDLGMITMINRGKVRPTFVRGKATWGRTYRLAGFQEVGETKGGLMVLQLQPTEMPTGRTPKTWAEIMDEEGL